MSQSSETTQVKEAEANPSVQVASGTLPAEVSKKAKKVELDIEDAPFLKESEPQQQTEPTEGGEQAEEGQAADPKKSKRKKILLIAGAAAVVLIAGAAGAWWFFGGAEQPPPPPVAEEKPEVIVVPSKLQPVVNPDIVKEFDRFIVPLGDTVESTKFLVCKFSTVTKNPSLEIELDQKKITLRDSIYYYLRNKTYDYLLDPANGPEIKKELVTLLNDYLSSGKLEDVLLDTYLGH
ncbi:MAG: flagellar basal body-associated FliL family protein [Desulfovibrio sp.]|nr:flagellar basal body-associated FliL family protein [Desulfovibrio sp.]